VYVTRSRRATFSLLRVTYTSKAHRYYLVSKERCESFGLKQEPAKGSRQGGPIRVEIAHWDLVSMTRMWMASRERMGWFLSSPGLGWLLLQSKTLSLPVEGRSGGGTPPRKTKIKWHNQSKTPNWEQSHLWDEADSSQHPLQIEPSDRQHDELSLRNPPLHRIPRHIPTQPPN